MGRRVECEKALRALIDQNELLIRQGRAMMDKAEKLLRQYRAEVKHETDRRSKSLRNR